MEPQTNTIAMVLVNAVIVTVAALYVILVRTLSVQLVTDVENAVTAMVQVNAPIAADQEKDNDNRLYHYIITAVRQKILQRHKNRADFNLRGQPIFIRFLSPNQIIAGIVNSSPCSSICRKETFFSKIFALPA